MRSAGMTSTGCNSCGYSGHGPKVTKCGWCHERAETRHGPIMVCIQGKHVEFRLPTDHGLHNRRIDSELRRRAIAWLATHVEHTPMGAADMSMVRPDGTLL